MSDREAMLARRAELLAEHPEIQACGDLARLMGQHERAYWEWILDRLNEEMDAAQPPSSEASIKDPQDPEATSRRGDNT